MYVTDQQLIKWAPASINVAGIVVTWFDIYADKYEVNTPLRIAAFFAQTIHESGSFKYTREIASGKAYEGRKDLGNIFPGDGMKFKGRGYLQISGRVNYASLSKYLFNDENVLLKTPDLIATPEYAMRASLWFWNKHGLNEYADKQWMETITKRINGGLNGFADRVHYYNIICQDLGLPIYVQT